MACPKCGCKVSYQYDNGWDGEQQDERLERCAACRHVFDIEDAADEDDEATSGVTTPQGADDQASLRQMLELVAKNLDKGMSKSFQRLQARSIREVLDAAGVAPTAEPEPHPCRFFNGKCIDCGRSWGKHTPAGVAPTAPAGFVLLPVNPKGQVRERLLRALEDAGLSEWAGTVQGSSGRLYDALIAAAGVKEVPRG